jgi:hypothetical protein
MDARRGCVNSRRDKGKVDLTSSTRRVWVSNGLLTSGRCSVAVCSVESGFSEVKPFRYRGNRDGRLRAV